MERGKVRTCREAVQCSLYKNQNRVHRISFCRERNFANLDNLSRPSDKEGKKKIEVSKTNPQPDEWDDIVYLYCSKDMRSFNRIPEQHREKYRKYLGTVGAKFACYEIEDILYLLESDLVMTFLPKYTSPAGSCLTSEELLQYGKGKPLYGWHISDLKIYDKPRELGEFKKPDKPYNRVINRDGCIMFVDGYESGKPLKRAPQSWQYVEEI